MSRSARAAVPALVVLSGGLRTSLEVAAFRIIGSKTFGSELPETTAVIAVFLTAMR